MHTPFPDTIKYIHIYGASFGTRELPNALMSSLMKGYGKPWMVSVTGFIEYNRDDILYIIICPAGFGLGVVEMPIYYISYQLEFMNGNYDNGNYKDILRNSLGVWDYSRYNINILRGRDAILAEYVPPGFNEEISSPDVPDLLYVDDNRDVDVLFLGYCDPYPRRLHIRDECYTRGMRIWFVSDLNIQGMREAIKRSKVCINMGVLHPFVLAKIRLNILLSNKACIVSEFPVDGESVEEYKDSCICFTEYDNIVERVSDLLSNFKAREAMATRSYNWYKNRRWEDIVDFNSLLP